jgi:hypothetical protein
MQRLDCCAFLDVFAVVIASNSFLLRWPFIGGKWRVSLAGNDGKKRDPPGDIVFELIVVGGLGK